VQPGDNIADNCGCVQHLLAAGADPHARNARGDTPLHFAAIQGNLEVAVALLAAGADVHATQHGNSSATVA